MLKQGDRWIAAQLEQYASALASDKPSMTETERLMMENASVARGVVMLILSEAGRSGFVRQIDGTWDLTPGMKELAKFLTAERRALKTIGLERRSRPTQTLEAYIDASYKRKELSPNEELEPPEGDDS